MHGFYKKHFSLVFLGLINLLFFYKTYFFNQVFFFGDTLTQRVPSMVFWKQQILSGHMPLWNPYIFAGIPHLADLSTNTLSPTNFIYLIIPNPFTALSYLAALLIFTSSVLSYVFLRQLKLTRHSSLFGAIVGAYSGTSLAAINDINSLMGISLIPLVLIALQRFLNHLSTPNLILAALALSLQFISSHPQYSYYTWILATAYLFTFHPKSFVIKIKHIALIFGFFLGLVSLQLLPFLELTTQTYRPTNLDFASQNQLHFLDLPRLFVVNIYGNWLTGTSWGPNSPLETGRATTEGFVGTIPIFLSLFALRKKTKHTHFFLATAAITFILAFGTQTPIYLFVRKTLPGFNLFRSPIRILSIYSVALAYLSAFGFQYISNKNHVKS